MDINNLNELYNYWFTDTECKNHWFNRSDDFDDIIYKKYKSLIRNINEKLNEKVNENNIKDLLSTKNIFLSFIILYDQITRHMYRGNKILINKYLDFIIPYVKKYYYTFKCDLNDEEFSFFLMPLRHSNEYTNILFVLKETWSRINNENKNTNKKINNICKNFLEATYRRYIKFNNDEINLRYIYNISDDSFNIYEHINLDYLDNRCNVNNNGNGNVYINIKEYFISCKLYNDVLYFIKKYNIKKCIISLSGGVDSMVLSYILKYLNINVYAVHINYNNRNECIEEEIIIINWCKRLSIPLFIRKIDEINRVQCMENNLRELYEDYTRDIRYQSYRNAIKHIKHNEDIKDIDNIYIFLGHNKDDSFENILTNIANKSHYDNLLGMEEICVTSNIKFARPMLNINKFKIYDIAKVLNIPFFLDSTPKWSMRGIIRDEVRPALEKWNTNIINSCFYLSENVSSLMKYVSNRANILIKEYIDNKYLCININELDTNNYFWNIVLSRLNIYISNKSLLVFIKRLINIINLFNTFKYNYKHKHVLNKNSEMIYYKDINNKLIIKFLIKY